MKVLIMLCLTLFYTCYSRICIPKHHYWQPYYDAVPPTAFVAGLDSKHEKKYIARLIPLDERSWSVPSTFNCQQDHVDFVWQNGSEVKRVDDFIEILSLEYGATGIGWYKIEKSADLRNLTRDCCPIEGGYGYKNRQKYVAFIGRVIKKCNVYVGAVYNPDWENRKGLRYVQEWNSHFTDSNYEVLTYSCL